MACRGQTFQYSRGWTNGKRDGSNGGGIKSYYPAPSSLQHYLGKEEDALSDIIDMPLSKTENDRKLER